jgi:hypothetical protein
MALCLEPVFEAIRFAAVVFAEVGVATTVLAVEDLAVDLTVADLPAVDLANVVDFAAGGLVEVDLAGDFVDFAALGVEVVALVVDCLVVDCAGANTAKAADRATGMEIANARKDPV